VTALVASGLMNKQIAHELSISEVTVKLHRGSAMRKLQAGSLARLARIAEILKMGKKCSIRWLGHYTAQTTTYTKV
jgi:FixJ family two-component response regulator